MQFHFVNSVNEGGEDLFFAEPKTLTFQGGAKTVASGGFAQRIECIVCDRNSVQVYPQLHTPLKRLHDYKGQFINSVLFGGRG